MYNTSQSNNPIEPLNKIDQDILLNLTSFFEKLIPFYSAYCSRSNSNILAKWIPLFIAECIKISNLYPMVSAMYRLMKCFLSLADSSWKDASSIHAPIRDYLIVLQPHLVRFQDELLSSALSMIFNMPLFIIDINYLIDCAAIALKVFLISIFI